jgi:hypothetical protein
VQFTTISNRTIGKNVLSEAIIKTMISGPHLNAQLDPKLFSTDPPVAWTYRFKPPASAKQTPSSDGTKSSAPPGKPGS